MGLIFKQSTTIGSNNAEWVPADFGTKFNLQVSAVGEPPNTVQHNYGLEFIPGVIKQADINPSDDLENLIGINFIQNPTILSNGQILRPRLGSPLAPWIREDRNLFPDSNFQTTNVALTIPRRRTKLTRGITHMLIQAGRASGILSLIHI